MCLIQGKRHWLEQPVDDLSLVVPPIEMSATTNKLRCLQQQQTFIFLKTCLKTGSNAMGIKCNAMQMRWGTCRHSPWGRRHPRRCWAPRLTSGWPRSASVAEVCPPASPPAPPTTWSPSWCRWAWWGCSPWWGPAWRQHLHFCPETFLNLPECDVSNLAKTDSDRGLQQIQPLHLYQSWKLLYVLVEKTLPLCCTAGKEEVMGFVGSKPTRAAWPSESSHSPKQSSALSSERRENWLDPLSA